MTQPSDYPTLRGFISHIYDEHVGDDASDYIEGLIAEGEVAEEDAMWKTYLSDSEVLAVHTDEYGEYVLNHEDNYDTYAEYLLDNYPRYFRDGNDSVMSEAMPESWVTVSRWLANRLREQGEQVVEYSLKLYWGRVGTGVNIKDESCFVMICQEIWERDYNPTPKPRADVEVKQPVLGLVDKTILIKTPDGREVELFVTWEVMVDRLVIAMNHQESAPVLFHIEQGPDKFYRPIITLPNAQARLLHRIIQQGGVDTNMPEILLNGLREKGLLDDENELTKAGEYMARNAHWHQERQGEEGMKHGYRRAASENQTTEGD